MKRLQDKANTLRSKGCLVSICRDFEWRFKAGKHVRRSVYRVAVLAPGRTSFDWEVCTFEFPWQGEDWLNDLCRSERCS